MKSARLDRNEVMPLLNGFFAIVDRACNGKERPHSAELDKYVHPDFHMKSNGQLVCKNNADLLLYLQDHQKNYSSVKFTELLEDPVIGGNKVVIRFDVELTDKLQHKKVAHVIAIITVDDSRLLQWSEVTNLEKL